MTEKDEDTYILISIYFTLFFSFIGVLGILYVVILVTAKYFLPHDPPKSVKTK